jgi:hypothetical protein
LANSRSREISEIKSEFCPDASVQAGTIGIVKTFPPPCFLVTAKLAYKKDVLDKGVRTKFGIRGTSTPTLRAVHATVNEAARREGLQFFKNWRVPQQSVIAGVFARGGYEEANEDLGWWRSSGGKQLKASPVRVKGGRPETRCKRC